MRFSAGTAGPWDARGEGSELGRKGSRECRHGPQPTWKKTGKVVEAGGWWGGWKQINRVVETIIIKRRVIKVKNGDCVTPKTNRNKRPVDPLYRCLALRDDRLKMPGRCYS